MTRLRRLLLGLGLVAVAVALLRLHAGGPVWTVQAAHPLGARTAAFADGGRLLVTIPHAPGEEVGWAGPVEVREAATGRLVRSFWAGESFRLLEFGADGRIVCVTTTHGLLVADPLVGEQWRRPLPPASYRADFSPDGALVFTAQVRGPNGVTIWDGRDGSPVAEAEFKEAWAGFSFAGGRAFLHHDDGGLIVWDLSRRRQTGRVEEVDRFRVSADGRVVLAREFDGGDAVLWAVSDPARLLARVPAGDQTTLFVADDGGVAVVVPKLIGGRLQALDGRTGRRLWDRPWMGGLAGRAELVDIVPSPPGLLLLQGTDGGGAGESLSALDLGTGDLVWSRLGGALPAVGSGGRLVVHHGSGIALVDPSTGASVDCALPPLDNVGNARFTADGTLWLQATIKPQPSWLPAWLVAPSTDHQRLHAIDANGRSTFTLAGRDLCGYLPFDDGSAVVAFHQHGGAQRVSLHDARHAPMWPRVAGVLSCLAGVALLIAACWPGVTRAPDASAPGPP